jgi:glycosyltransferase involved in cell wall biosynthesis
MVPYVFTIHGIPLTPQQKGRIVRQAYFAYLRIGVGRTSRFARSITAISEAVAKALPQAEGVEVIPNGLTPLPTSDEIGAQRLRSGLNIAPGVPIIACAGRLTRAKGFDTLLKSLNYVHLPKVVCVVAGTDGGLLPELKRLQAGLRPSVTVHFIGRQDRQGLADLFHLASVVAVPSRDEPFGLVALEAIGAGRRVVASNIGGLPEFLSPPLAELVPEGDPVALASALVVAIRRGALSASEAAAAHNVVSRHSWKSLALRYEALLAPTSRTDARKQIQEPV